MTDQWGNEIEDDEVSEDLRHAVQLIRDILPDVKTQWYHEPCQ